MNYVLDMGPDPHTGRSTFKGGDVWFFPLAVDQRYDWPTAEAFECHIKFSQ